MVKTNGVLYFTKSDLSTYSCVYLVESETPSNIIIIMIFNEDTINLLLKIAMFSILLIIKFKLFQSLEQCWTV